MLKTQELQQGCMARALDDEMTFVLLGRDLAAPATIRYWCLQRMAMGQNQEHSHQIIEAHLCANTMERQRDEIRAKLASVDREKCEPRQIDTLAVIIRKDAEIAELKARIADLTYQLGKAQAEAR